LTRIADALDRITRLAFDTPPVIYLIEQHPAYHALVRAIFRQISAGTVLGITSIVTLVEVLTLPLVRRDTRLVARYRGVLLHSRNLHVVDLDTAIAERAAELRARYRLRSPDALQLAASLMHGAEAFLTNDRALSRVTELRVLVLDELEL
jgi:predicted nucleic acid-binding protein